MSDYNYDAFSAKDYDLDAFIGPQAGTKAPDFQLSTPDGETARLLDFPEDFLVLEFGSITCPLYQGRRAGMEKLATSNPKISFSVLYVREAHPGSNFPAHKSLEGKIANASALQDEDGETRRILIDDMQGAAHSAYGSYPNSIFIINKNGCVVFRSDWNSVPATRSAIKNLLSGKPASPKSYFFPVKPTLAIKTLQRSGKGALPDFLSSLPGLIWKNLLRRNFLLLMNAQDTISPDTRC
jgi:hypothetical protein